MNNSFDVIIIGGGIIGLSSAYHLSKRGIKTIILEKNYPGSGSTTRCIGGIRKQFSTETSIKLMQESMRQFEQMEDQFGFSVEFFQGGYLFLAFTEETLNSFKKIADFQRKFGLNVKILSVEDCLDIVPCLNAEGLYGGVYSPEDAQAYPFKVVEGYIEEIKKNGSIIRPFSEVKKIIVNKDKVEGVKLSNGEVFFSNTVLNAGGPWATDIGDMVGVSLPIFPEEHEAFITDRMDHLFDTMIVDYRPDGCYFQQLVSGQVIGCYTPIPNKAGTDTSSSLEFLLEMSKRTIRLIPKLKKAYVLRHWGGSYCMTPDGRPIIDKTGLSGFYIAVGMSGHGFMFAPAVGKYISEIILDNKYPINWDEFKLERDFTRKELMK
jgi:sarcosine oxidase subunit beta